MENKTKIDKTKLLKEASERMTELDELKEVEEMIQDNAIEFDFEGIPYRVRKLNRREKHEIRRVQSQEKYRLLNEKDNASEEELIQIYLNRDNPINIPAMRDKIKSIQAQIDKLAVVFTECAIDSEKMKLEAECEKFQQEQLELIYKIDDCLNTSVENQLKSFIQEYMIYLCLEKSLDEKWERHYKNYEAFMDITDSQEDKLVYKATWYFTILINKDD